jgi:hypothetical protein
MGHDSTADDNPKSDEKPGPTDDGSKVSATSMFAAIPAADAPAVPSVDSSPVTARPEAPSPKSPPSPQPGMPVVHEVVFPSPGSRPSEGSASILSTLRSLAADEKVRAAELPPASYVTNEPPPAKPNAAASSVQSQATPGADVSFVQSPVSVGFTELLRALSETPAPPPVSPPPPVETNPSPPPSSANSFTRLLRALDAKSGAPPTASADAVSISKRAEPAAHQMPAPLPGAEDATALTRREPGVTAMSPAPAAAPTAAFPSPPIRRTPASEPKVEPPPPSVGSFTQLFQALDRGGSDRHAPVSETPPATAAASPSDASKSAGSFTDLFQAIDSDNSTASSPVGPVAAIPSASTAPVTSATPSGDGLTQMFQAIDRGNASSSAPVISGSATEKASVAPEAQSAESFTQLFRAIESGPSNVPPVVAPASANSPPNMPSIAPAAPSGASFTELFRAIDPDAGTSTPPPTPPVLPSSMAVAPAAHEVQPADSFTQMFRAVDSVGTPGSEPSRSPQSWGQTPPPQGAPPPRSANPLVADQRSDGSSLTQLLRTLDQSDAVPDAPNPTPVQPPGPFTSIYGERSPAGNQVERMQPAPATPNFSQPADVASPGRSVLSEPAASACGSSDFTRILQASSMREQALKRGEQPIEPPQQAAPANPPAVQPQMPGFPVGAPQFPHSNVLPPLNLGHGSATPSVQSFKGAPSLAPPQWMPPAPPPPTPAPVTKTQPLLPLVLIGIIFVLVVVLVAVVFLFKH